MPARSPARPKFPPLQNHSTARDRGATLFHLKIVPQHSQAASRQFLINNNLAVELILSTVRKPKRHDVSQPVPHSKPLEHDRFTSIMLELCFGDQFPWFSSNLEVRANQYWSGILKAGTGNEAARSARN